MIIFDLDDTLIDTTGAVTAFQLKKALRKMIADGLNATDFEGAYRRLLEMDLRSLSSKDTLIQFVDEMEADPAVGLMGIQEMSSTLPDDFVVPTTGGAKEILEYLRPLHRLVLVTGGRPLFQMEKLKKAGIDPSYFSKIAIPEDSIKKPHYEEIYKEFSESPCDVWVCGDRVPMDLAPAHELGFKTVHMRWGRGLNYKKEDWIDYEISSLLELKGILDDYFESNQSWNDAQHQRENIPR